MGVLCIITKHLFPAPMKPSYALLPATSYPKTVGGMCYAIIEAHIDRLKSSKLFSTNQGSGDKIAWVVDMLSWHAVA